MKDILKGFFYTDDINITMGVLTTNGTHAFANNASIKFVKNSFLYLINFSLINFLIIIDLIQITTHWKIICSIYAIE